MANSRDANIEQVKCGGFMRFEDILKSYFDKVYTEADFVEKTYSELNKLGFNADNSITCIGVCRDEICQSLVQLINKRWGYAFNLSSLAGMFFAGKTGLMAAMHHSPIVNGKERYVFNCFPHIAISKDGEIGIYKRRGRSEKSTACGALSALQKEIFSGKINPAIDNEDIEQSMIRIRLLKEIPHGKIPDLLELTRITQKAIQTDLENTINKIVDIKKNDYAVITGIQIHGPENNYVCPAYCYALVNEKRIEIKL